MRLLFSTKLMFASLLLLTAGCFMRVGSGLQHRTAGFAGVLEILAYQGFAHWAWSLLPVSAATEMIAVTAFAANLVATFVSRPPSSIA